MVKKLTTLYFLTALFSLTSIRCEAIGNTVDEKPRWANPEKFSINAEPPHAFSLVYPDTESARPEPDWTNPFAASDRYLVLNGQWKFQWAENPASAPTDFTQPARDLSEWDDIRVPLPWQMAGYGQLYYFNSKLPMLNDSRNQKSGEADLPGNDQMDLLDPKMPRFQQKAALDAWVPSVWNPVGSYVTEFSLPNHWEGKRIVLHFSGVKGASTCWINGHEVGYYQDAFTPVEYDITRFVKPGINRLAVQVIRWHDGSYLENQDRIRMSGIIRDVYIFATPRAHIGNFFVRPVLKESLDSAQLSIDVELRNTGDKTAAGHSVEIVLIDPTGEIVWVKGVDFPKVAPGKTVVVTVDSALDAPVLWHPESPQLYTALIKLKQGSNEEEVIRQDVGFRRFSWDQKGSVYLNGKRYHFRGVNRSDIHPELGYSVDYEDMLADATLMRRLNIDNVRAAHNPNDIRWYALCNRFGITLIDEANVEAHGHERIFSDPAVEAVWRKQAVARMVAMVEHNKNQPSIIMWSLGNEQFERGEPDPAAVREMFDAAKAIDSTRPVFCERMFCVRKKVIYGDFLEFVGPMYSGMEFYKELQTSSNEARPFFYSEYAHAMGNSMANLADEWVFLTSNEGMNGGQIWDWRDQSVLTTLPGLEGRHLTYGGDWGDESSHGVFCMNGIVLPDRRFNGKTYEVKGVYQQVHFDNASTPGKFRARNEYAMQNLHDFVVTWTLLKHGVAIRSGCLDLDLQPKHMGEFNLPVDPSSFDSAFDYHLNFDVSLKEPTRWADAGYVVAESQILLQEAAGPRAEVLLSGIVSADETVPNRVEITSGDAVLTFDLGIGLLTQYRYRNKDVLAPDTTVPGLEMNFNLHPTDDYHQWPSPPIRKAIERGLNALRRQFVSAHVVEQSADRVWIETVHDYLNPQNEGYRHTALYTVLPGGIVQVDNHVQRINLLPNDICFRIGIRLPIQKEFAQASYRAYGPHENYPDRRTAARQAVYRHDAADFFQHYVRPQENGGRSGLEWIALQNPDGIGLQIAGEDSRGCGSIMPWSFEQFQQATHVPYFPLSDRWILHYDSSFSGIGRKGGVRSVPFKEDYAFSYSLRPLDGRTPSDFHAYPAIPNSALPSGAGKPFRAEKKGR